jgi:hypothetical protein
MADDPLAIHLFRSGAVFVLTRGRLLAQIRWEKGAPACLVHSDLAVNPEKRYTRMEERRAEEGALLSGLRHLAALYPKVTARAGRLAPAERRETDILAARLPQIIEREPLLPGGRGFKPFYADLAAVDAKGTLVFFEVKRAGSPDFAPADHPRLAGQVDHYEQIISENARELADNANRALRTFKALEGAFFRARADIGPVRSVHPRVRVLVAARDTRDRVRFGREVLPSLASLFAWPRRPGDIQVFAGLGRVSGADLFSGL